MKVSANEVMALVGKAARGAGAPAGQAAAFGQAALHHLASGKDPADLVAALNALPGGPILEMPLLLSRLLERSQDGEAQGHLAPAGPLSLMQSYLSAQPFATDVTQNAEGLEVTAFLTRPNAAPVVTRVDLPDDLAGLLNRLAAKTFVPETAASRLSGAGAGLTDND